MAVDWLDKSDNPAMNEWGVSSEDIYGAIVLINLHELRYKIALTNDFTTWQPIHAPEQLQDLEWLDPT